MHGSIASNRGDMKEGRRQSAQLALYGALFGAAFPAVAVVLVFVFSASSIALLIIIAFAIPVLGTVGYLIGVREDRMITLAADLETRVGERTSAIQSMLDVTGDGFLTFGSDYLVREEYSRPAETIFGGAIAGRRIADLLFMEDSDRQEFVEGLDLFFKGTAKAEVIFDLLEKRVEIADRVISVDYRAIDDGTVLLALTDITDQERLEAEVAEQNRRRDLILKVVSNKAYFASYVEEANDLFQVLDAVSSHRTSAIPDETAERLAAQVHTFKGNANFLGFTRTATVAHDFEDQLVALPILQGEVDLSSEVFVMKRQFYEEYNAIAETLGDQWINDLSKISVPVASVEKVEQYVRGKYGADKALVRAMEQLRSVPMSSLFSRYPQMIADLAGRRGRRVKPVSVRGGDFRVLPEQYDNLVNALTHIARNMVDHGIESPAEREMKGKSDLGTIAIDIERDRGEIAVSFSDDGRGISFAAVEAKARELGMIENGNEPSRSELLGYLFSAGFSTADEVTMVSGRGVGLNAVQRAVQQLGGKIAVETRPGRGTTFRITVPDSSARRRRG